MPRFTPYAAQEIAIVSSTPAGSGFPIGLIPGALPSDQASRQTLKTTAVRLPLGHTQFTGLVMGCRAPRFFLGTSYQLASGWAKAHHRAAQLLWPLVCLYPRRSRDASAPSYRPRRATLPSLRLHDRNALNPSSRIFTGSIMDNAHPAAVQPWYEVVQQTLKRNDVKLVTYVQ